jgi:hypothetical protein
MLISNTSPLAVVVVLVRVIAMLIETPQSQIVAPIQV